MRVLIYGGGAVGLGVASCLVRPPNHVEIIARGPTTNALRKEGLTRTGIFGRVHAPSDAFTCHEALDRIDATEFDYVLICTKSFDSSHAAGDLANHGACIGQGAKLVLFQNGWGNAEAFCEHFDKSRVYSARVITGFRRPRPNEVEVTVHADAIHLGSLFGQDASAVEPLGRAIREGGIPCETTDSIEKDLWAKMLYNCSLNPLGAVLGVSYGSLAQETSTRMLMGRIVEEVFAVMVQAGFRTHWTRPDEFLDVFYRRLVPDTAGHKSSMLQDIAAGRRTEIDALNGVVIRLAQQHGVAVPYNQAVYSLIQFIENREWPARE
ncbi:MAG TPA: 2-dehydropantoate 2-reductase [Sedimentisphaerales bacterium]|jgi:2-dehydropantoate 2-reductase|nr:2-dehydropantoate 2-reductase [Sedimentisphaerales bacterium]HNU30146.1 2-dehydropantoate 2-reductase [Sedimentisphaerales bacterium]